jgi:hypothetical protein
MRGGAPEANAIVDDLAKLRPGNPERVGKTPGTRARSDADLLNSVFKPRDRQYIATNSDDTMIVQGNHRAAELMRRAADPASSIEWDTPIFINYMGRGN